jgi:hypothetical protein
VVPLVAGRRSHRHVVAAICPDCARPDDPDRPLSNLLIFTFVVVALGTLWLWSTPGGPSSWLTAAIAAAWVVVVVGYGRRARRAGWSGRHDGGHGRSWRWAVPPLVGALVAVAVLGALPLRARFAISRPSIESAADDAAPGVGTHGRLVAYPAGVVSRSEGTIAVFVSTGCGFFRPDSGGADAGGAGTVAPPSGPIELDDEVRLGGGWRSGCLVGAVGG